MEYRENPMFGRSVFFLNPPLSVENYVVDCLKEREYEVYVINDYRYAKPLLRTRENAICFIYVDDELSLDAWYNFIKSFETDPSLSSIFLGVLSVKTKLKDQEKFLMNLKLPGGFVILDKNLNKIADTIEGILKINGAKGVRKCLRLELKDNNDVNGYFAAGSLLYSFKLVDISSLGFAAMVPAKMASVFKKDSVINNVSITMGRYSFVCSVVIYNTKIVKNECLVVMLLHKETGVAIKRKIHDYIYDTLEIRNKILLESLIGDLTDYNVRKKDSDEIQKTEKDTDDISDSEENVESLETLEDSVELETEQ